jgi:hypothetical protein
MMPNGPAILIYADVPPYDWLTKFLMAAIPGAFLITGLVLVFFSPRVALAMFVDLAVFALFVSFGLPRRYELYTTELRIVLGWPFRWNIPLSTIAEARPARSRMRWIYWGARLPTSSGTLVEIVRRKGWNTILSPSNRETFLEQLDRALEALPH